MFDVFCERCESTVLLGPRRIVSLENTDDGIVLTYRCYCGEVDTDVLGRAPHRRTEHEATKGNRTPSQTEPSTRAPDGGARAPDGGEGADNLSGAAAESAR